MGPGLPLQERVMFGSMGTGIGQTEDTLTVKDIGRDHADIVYGMKGNGNVAVADGTGEKEDGIVKVPVEILAQESRSITWPWRSEDHFHLSQG